VQESSRVDDKAARQLKLKKATEAFESIFIAQMLKNMRSASFSTKDEDGFGKDVMLTMADEGVAKHLAKSRMLGVGDVLYEHLLKRLDTEETDGADGDGLKLTRYLPRVMPLAADATSVSSSETDWKEKFQRIIQDAARESDLSPQLLEAVISAESSGNPNAVSRKGAVGLMQLMPDTAKAIGVNDPLDPAQNVSGGARYLRQMLDRFDDLRLALSAYNAGPVAVERYDGIPPFRETQSYVDRIISDISDDN
jgi:Rod binding domain-containing protein